ncbi:MAG: hypothetical protein ACAI38_26000 [Myxococcota bacterium]
MSTVPGGSPRVGMSTRAHALAVGGAPNAGLTLPEPQPFVPDPSMAHSPALLVNYTDWVRDFDAVTERGTAARAFRELTIALYERTLEGPRGERGLADFNTKLAELRRHLCAGDAPVCTLPERVNDDLEMQAIADVLTSPAVIEAMRARYGFDVQPVTFLNSQRTFDLLMSRRVETDRRTVAVWDMRPREVHTTFATPVQRGLDSYRASIERGSFPGVFAMGREGVVVDDWLLRDRAMAFAHTWKRSIDMNSGEPLEHPISDANDLQYRRMREELRGEFDAAYERLLPRVAGDAEVRARFERERAAGDYPAEVYQHVAYPHLREMARLQSSFYVLALAERPDSSARQMALESMLTLQRYTPAWRFLLTELASQSQPIFARAAVIDQMADPVLAFTYVAEQLKAILGDDVYASEALYERMSYAVLADELFEPRYLREYQPEIHRELLQSDGSLRRVADLPRADQVRLLRRYMVNADGTTSPTGVVRMRSVLTTRIREDDLRHLAGVIHRARVPQR